VNRSDVVTVAMLARSLPPHLADLEDLPVACR
jgi:hypothetical protein